MSQKRRIGEKAVKEIEKHTTIYDIAVVGFGIRRQSQNTVSYILRYRTKSGTPRTYTIGKAGTWLADDARKEALRLLAEIHAGGDPARTKQESREVTTVSELCDEYYKDVTSGRVLIRGGKTKAAHTIRCDKSRLENHIKPLIGKVPVKELTRRDVENMLHSIAEGKTARTTKRVPRGGLTSGGRSAANRAVSLLGAIMRYAVRRGMRSDNPSHDIMLFAETPRERRLSDAEYKTLGNGLRAPSTCWPYGLRAAHFLALTGWRCGEVLGLKWMDIDFDRRTVILAETKTGKSMRPLSSLAIDLLKGLPRLGDHPLVFPPSRNAKGLIGGFRQMFNTIGLPSDISPHVLRHSFASVAADLGYSELTIAALIGHRSGSVTSRYIHSADAVLLQAADAVAAEIDRRMA